MILALESLGLVAGGLLMVRFQPRRILSRDVRTLPRRAPATFAEPVLIRP